MAAPAWLIGLAAAEAALRTPVTKEPCLYASDDNIAVITDRVVLVYGIFVC